MTRPKAIKMVPDRLPPLTKAQRERVAGIRRLYGSGIHLSVIRKNQVPGHICVSWQLDDGIARIWYDQHGKAVGVSNEPRLFRP